MILTCHTPLFIPWKPFFDKMEQVDTFIFLTQTPFMRNGFCHYFYLNNKLYSMRVKERNGDYIYNSEYQNPFVDYGNIKNRLLEYRKILEQFDDVIYEHLLATNVQIIDKIAKMLDIKTVMHLDYSTNLRKTDRLVDICKTYGATTYMADESGRNILELEKFYKHDIHVKFFSSDNKLSILQVLNEETE